jgi:prepilin-type N-terminal cleavage/methylation domain-containing protein
LDCLEKVVVMMGARLTNKRRKSGGYTLVEIMVSSIILLIVSCGIMSGIISALKAQANAADYYRATCIARNRIQQAKTALSLKIL